MKFSITNETDLYKKSSVILSSVFAVIAAVGPAILETFNSLPPDLRDALPYGPARWVATVAFLLILVARCTHFEMAPEQDDSDA